MIATISETALIFKREIVVPRNILWAAVVAALIPAVPSLLSPIASHERDTFQVGMALVLAFTFGSILAIWFGATLLGGLPSTKRLTIAFEQTTAPTAVWLGRFLALFVQILVCEAIILFPYLLSRITAIFTANTAVFLPSTTWQQWVIVFTVVPAILLLLSHCAAVMLRARTAWLIADMVGLVAMVAWSWAILPQGIVPGFRVATTVLSTAVTMCCAIALVAATVVGTSRGRSDLRRTHRSLSATLWGVLVVGMLPIGIYAQWLFNFGPEELTTYRELTASPDGRWLEVQGSTVGHLDVHRRFLLSTDGRRQIVIPFTSMYYPQTRYSDSGNRAIWLNENSDASFTVWQVDLQHRNPKAHQTTITTRTHPKIVVSPEGDRLAIVEPEVLSVYDIKNERLVMTAPLDVRTFSGAFSFLGRDRLRIVFRAWDKSAVPEIVESYVVGHITLSQGEKFQITSSITIPFRFTFSFDDHLQYAVADCRPLNNEPNNMTRQQIFEIESGRVVGNVKGFFRGFAPDGRVWSISDGEDGGLWVILEQPGSGDSSAYGIGNPDDGTIVGMAANGGLVIARKPEVARKWINDRWITNKLWASVEMIDLETEKRRPIGAMLSPYGLTRYMFGGHTGNSIGWSGSKLGYPPSGAPNLLFKDVYSSLLGWDPVREELVPLVGHKSR